METGGLGTGGLGDWETGRLGDRETGGLGDWGISPKIRKRETEHQSFCAIEESKESNGSKNVIPSGMTNIVARGEAKRNLGEMNTMRPPSAVANRKMQSDHFGRK